MSQRVARALLLGAQLTIVGSALAQTPSAAPTTEREPPAAKPKPKPKPRADQARSYSRKPGTEPEDVALATPRALLAVPRYALKLVFWPIREGIELLDRHAVIEEVTDVLYNDERNAAILPTLSIDSNFGPSFGIKAFHEDLAGHDEYASVEARFGGIYNLATQLHFRADHYGGSNMWIENVARFESDPALLFQGIGNHPETSGGDGLDPRERAVATRFSEQRFLSLTRVGYSAGRPSELLQVGGSVIYNVRDFGAKQKGDEPSIEQVYDTSRLVGFAERVPVIEADLNLIVDLRDVPGATSSGAYFEAFGGRAPNWGRYGFWHHGAELTGYLNLYRHTRVLVLRAMVEGVEGRDAEIPFSELPRLGGPSRLRGYPLDRFRDEKAALGTIEYRYPIHQYVAGALYCDVGRVAKTYSNFFDSRWRAGFGGGLVVRSREHQLFTFDVAYGEGFQFYLTTDPLRAFAKRDTEL